MAMKPTSPVNPVADITLLLEGMSNTGFQGRKLGESVGVWSDMIKDPDCTILLGLSGAMIPGGMQKCLIELVERHYVDVIVSTGANIFHDACEHLGVRHYMGHHHVDDGHLFSQGIDRIYDVFAYEEQFRNVDRQIADFAGEHCTVSRVFSGVHPEVRGIPDQDASGRLVADREFGAERGPGIYSRNL